LETYEHINGKAREKYPSEVKHLISHLMFLISVQYCWPTVAVLVHHENDKKEYNSQPVVQAFLGMVAVTRSFLIF